MAVLQPLQPLAVLLRYLLPLLSLPLVLEVVVVMASALQQSQ